MSLYHPTITATNSRAEAGRRYRICVRASRAGGGGTVVHDI